MHFVYNSTRSKPEHREGPIRLKLLCCGPEGLVLRLPRIKTEQVQHAQSITVLLVAQRQANLIKNKLCIHFCLLLCRSTPHHKLAHTRHWFQHILVIRHVVFRRNQLIQLLLEIF